MVRTVLYVVAGLVVAGVAFNVLSGMGLVNGVSQPSAAAGAKFSATGNITTRVEISTSGNRKEIDDLSGTVTNTSGRACGRTAIVETMLDQHDAVVDIKVASNVATTAGQTAQWNTSLPHLAQATTVTHATWTALCSDPK